MKTELIFWVLPNSGLQTPLHLRAMLSEFERSHPDIEVRFSVMTRQMLWQRLFLFQREHRAGEIPDIIEIPSYWTALFSKLSFIEDLSGLDSGITAEGVLDPLRGHSFMPGTSRIFSLPWWMEVSALIYRVDHLKKVTSNPEELFKTWGGFVQACELLSKKKSAAGYYPVENSNRRGSFTIRDVLPCIWDRGGDVFTADATRCVIHREEALRGLEDYLGLFLKGYMPLMHERGSLGTMAEGKTSMILSRRQGPEVFAEDKKSGFQVKTLPVPGDLAGSHGYLSAFNLALVRESENKNEALSLLKWLVKSENQIKYSKLIQAFPVSAAGFEKFIFSSSERMGTYSAIVGAARPVPNIMVSGTCIEVLDESMSKIGRALVKGEYSPALLLQEMIKVQVEMDYLLSIYGD